MNFLKEKYTKEIVPALKEKFNYKNDFAVPKMVKVSINVGLGKNFKDAKLLEVMEGVLLRISGQKPIKTRARLSISNFKIREGNIIGMAVTLRGERMYDFVNKLINITLPRVRDFRGLPKSIVDKTGNASIGLREHMAFPEISSDEVEVIHGLEVNIDTTAKNQEEGIALLTALGFPFIQEEK